MDDMDDMALSACLLTDGTDDDATARHARHETEGTDDIMATPARLLACPRRADNERTTQYG